MTAAGRAAFVLAFVLSAIPSRAQSPRVLVMPFENVAHDSRIVWLSEAVAVLLADELNARGLEATTREERRAAFDRLRVPPAVSLTDATTIRIGRLVSASEVVVGHVRLDDEVLRIHARSIALDTGRLRDSIVEEGPLADVFAVVERIGRTLVGGIGLSGGGAPRPRPPVAAFERYIKGLLAATPGTALGYLDSAIELAPDFAAPRLAQWEVHTAQGDDARALAAVEGVLPSAREYLRARFLAGLSHLALARPADAFASFKAVADVQPTAGVLNNLGIAQLRRGGADAPSATYYFTSAADADSGDPDLCFNLGYAYWLHGDANAAIYWLREAVRRNPADSDAHLVLSVAMDRSGQAVEARRELDLAERLSERYAASAGRPAAERIPPALERVATDFAGGGQTRVDAALLDARQRDERAIAAYHVDRARQLFGEERDDEALDQLRRALFLLPYDPDAHVLAGRLHLRAGRPADAVGSLQIALWSLETAAAHAALASAHLEAGDLVRARTHALRALELEPGHVEAARALEGLDGR
jgi:tetratricopeptide (TPR) repeat protein/TolB-like protein